MNPYIETIYALITLLKVTQKNTLYNKDRHAESSISSSALVRCILEITSFLLADSAMLYFTIYDGEELTKYRVGFSPEKEMLFIYIEPTMFHGVDMNTVLDLEDILEKPDLKIIDIAAVSFVPSEQTNITE